MKLLTEPEAATIMRCSREKIKRLRLSGKLAYLPGRPVLIDERDLLALIDNMKTATAPKRSEAKSAPAVQDARKWAMSAVLLRREPRKRI